MKVRIIKSENCSTCKFYIKRLNDAKFTFESYDGDEPANSKQLDDWGIEDYPVVQIVQDEKILYQFPSQMTPSPDAINKKIKQISQKQG